MQQTGWRRARIIALIALPLAALGLWLVLAPLRAPSPATVALTISLPDQVSASAIYVADQKKLFAKNGLDIKLQSHLLGRQALQAMLEGKSDLALVADTPFMLAVMRGERVAALATVFASRRTMAIYALRKRGIEGAATLSGKTIGTLPGTNAEFFLDTMLDVHRIKRASANVVALKPDQLVDAVRKGDVDAVTVWNPDLAKLEQEFGDAGVTIYGEDLFTYRFLIVGKQAYIDKHPETVRRALLSISEGNDFIHANPEAARAMLGAAVGMAPALLVRSFNPSDFKLVLDQSLLLALSEQTRWAQKKGLVQGAMPNYLDYVRRAPLHGIAPDADKIIR